MNRKANNIERMNEQKRKCKSDSENRSISMSLDEFAVFIDAKEREEVGKFVADLRSIIKVDWGVGYALAVLQLKDGYRAGLHLVTKSEIERFAIYVNENTLDRWQFLEAMEYNQTIADYSNDGWHIYKARWVGGGVQGELPAKSATEDLPPGLLLKMTALGFEVEDVGGSLFVWCPMARKLLFSNHRMVAKWIRSVWVENPHIGIGSDCIIIPKGQNLQFHFIDEETPLAVRQMSVDEARDIGCLPFIYVRSFDRSEVHICLPDER